MDIDDLVEVCVCFNNLGWAVSDQASAVVTAYHYDNLHEVLPEQNKNALRMIVDDFLSEVLFHANNNNDDYLISQTEELIDEIVTFLEVEEEND